MTVKKAHALNQAYALLVALCEDKGRMVTAGEFAKVTGLSRNTAWKRLMDMAVEDVVNWEVRASGRVSVARFGVYGFKWDGAK